MSSSAGEPLRPRLAVIAGPTATVLNRPPLVTGHKARQRHGLAHLAPHEPEALRPQRLARPATVYVEQHSAHPLEAEAADAYAPPDAWIASDGQVLDAPTGSGDVPAYEIELRPEDGLYPLPFMGRRVDGGPWESEWSDPEDPSAGWRQPFLPDAARLFEEIDRLMVDPRGRAGRLARLAEFDHLRAAPSGGYRSGLSAEQRTDVGEGDLPPERLGEDFFPYLPAELRQEPPRAALAEITHTIQDALDSGRYAGALWLEGSPFVEETAYWLNLLLDTRLPIAATAGSLGAASAENVIDAVRYLVSGIWADDRGRDRLGVVGVIDEQVLAARELQKRDDRPGGFTVTGDHGGVLASMGKPGPPVLTFLPVRRSTADSEVALSRLPHEVQGLRADGDGRIAAAPTRTREPDGRLVARALPDVHVIKHARYQQAQPGSDDTAEVEVWGRIRRSLQSSALVGLVLEAGTPYGDGSRPVEAALAEAAYAGVPCVRVGRGDVGGFVPHERVPFGIAGGNLSATKARLLLMACLLRFGALPVAEDPARPTAGEQAAARDALARYQAVFDTH